MLFLWVGYVAYVLTLVALKIFVDRYGGPEERLATNQLLLCSIASNLASYLGAPWTIGLPVGIAVVDVAFFAMLLNLVRRSRKFWPLWAAAAQGVGTLTHLVRLVRPTLALEVYASIQPLWAFPIIVAIICGASRERFRKLGW